MFATAISASPAATAIICALSFPFGVLAMLDTTPLAHSAVAAFPLFLTNEATKDLLYMLLDFLITNLPFHFGSAKLS